MKKGILTLAFLSCLAVTAQNNTSYWQQEANYKMNVDMNVDNFQYTGEQELE